MRFAALVCAASFAFAARSAEAQQTPKDPAAARALFFEGRELLKAGRPGEACPKLEESLKLDYGIGTQYNLADCWEQIGRTASAWVAFLDVAAAARAAGQAEREQVARERAARLEPRLSRLKVEVQAAGPELEVTRDGLPLGRASWGSAMPVDPGVHVIAAREPDKKAWSERVQVREGAAIISVTIPPLAADGDAPSSSADMDARHLTSPESERGDGASHRGVLIAGVTTGVLVTGAVVVGVLYMNERQEFDRANAAREPDRFDERDDARKLGIVNLALAGASIVSAGVTTYLWIDASNSDAPETARSVGLAPTFGSSFLGASVRGRL